MAHAEPSLRSRTNREVNSDLVGHNGRRSHVAPSQDDGHEQTPARENDAVCENEQHGDWKDRYVRLKADFENYKRHAEAQRDRLAGIGKETVLEDVFPIVEHMERAIKATRDADDQTGILEGIEMVYQELLRLLEKHGVERIRTVGELFDPEIHEAVAVAPHPRYPEHTVVEEVRAGFAKDGKLLRPASVVVAR